MRKKMKKTVFAYIYLLLYPSLALDCQCKNTTTTQAILLQIIPKIPEIGDDICLCCHTKNVDYINYLRNNETFCPKSMSRCRRENDALKIKNITNEHSGNWTCVTKYDISNVVQIKVNGHVTSTTLGSSDVTSSTKTTAKANTTTNLISQSTTVLFGEQHEQNGRFDWPLWLCIALIVLLFLTVITICKNGVNKCKRRPYDKLIRRVRHHQQQNVSVRFNAEELLQIGTSLDSRGSAACDYDSHSYSSLSSGSEEAVADLPQGINTGIISVPPSTVATIHFVASPPRSNLVQNTEASAKVLVPDSSSPIHLSDAEEIFLNIVCSNIQPVFSTGQPRQPLQTTTVVDGTNQNTSEVARNNLIETDMSGKDDNDAEYQSMDDDDEECDSLTYYPDTNDYTNKEANDATNNGDTYA